MIKTTPSNKDLLWPVGLFFVSFVLIYGLHFLRLGLHQDEILDFYGQATDTYTAGGRWGTTLYHHILGLGSNIWSGPLMTGVFMSLAVGIQVRFFAIQGKLPQSLFVLLSLLCNQLAYLITYSCLSDALALGTLCATLAAYIALKSQLFLIWRGLLAALLLCIALGTYQSNALYFAVLVLSYLFLEHMKSKNILQLRLIISLASISLIAVLLWGVIRSLSLPLASTEALDYTLAYQVGMSQWGDFTSLSWTARFYFVAHYAKASLLEALGLMHAGQWLNMLSLLAVILLGLRVIKTKRILLGLTLLGAIWLLPYALTLALGTVQDPRIHIASGLSLAFLGTTAWQQLSVTRQQQLRIVLLSLLACSFLKSLYWVSERAKFEADYYRSVTQQLLSMEGLRQQLSYKQQKELEMVVFWEQPEQAAQKEFMQAQFGKAMPPVGVLSWYARHNNLCHIRPATAEETEKCKTDRQSKKPWPSFESIHQDGDIIYIKVGKYYEREQHLKL